MLTPVREQRSHSDTSSSGIPSRRFRLGRGMVPAIAPLSALIVAALAGVCLPDDQAAIAEFKGGDFIVIPQSEIREPEYGLVMECPAHAHGTPDQAYAKLQEILKNRPQGAVSTIWVCRANQMQTLKRFAPLVDQVVVNPYVMTSAFISEEADAVWGAADHPFLNELRELHRNGSGKRLLACIELQGTSRHFAKRSPSFEEIQWMVYAVVGASFKGVVWRGQHQEGPVARQLTRLESRFAAVAGELGAAKPVLWARSVAAHPVSSLASGKKLFVVVVNPAFMVPAADGKIPLPLENTTLEGDIELTLPSGVTLGPGATISDKRIRLSADEGRARFHYDNVGSAEIFVCDLLRGGTPNSPTKTEQNQSSASSGPGDRATVQQAP